MVGDPTLVEQLRSAIQESGQTPAQIARGSGVSRTVLTRGMSAERRGFSLESLDAICRYLNLRLTKTPEEEDSSLNA